MENDLLEIGIFGEQPPVFHARAYSSGHVTQLDYVYRPHLSSSDCWRLACSFLIVGGEVAQPPVLCALLCHGRLLLRYPCIL